MDKAKGNEKQKQARVAVIDYDNCAPDKCGNFLCIRVCPVNRIGQECIIESPDSHQPLISEDLCTGCGICINKCPFEAITILNVSAKLQVPLHQFGQNLFRLYRLPLPREKSVVGIIGRNGTGKTTA